MKANKNKQSTKMPPRNSTRLTHFARLRNLDGHYSMATALVLTERMMINAELYWRESNLLQQIDIAQDIIEQFWMRLFNRKSKLNVDTIQTKLEGLFHSDLEPSLAAQACNDFIVALGICLDAFADKDSQPAVEVAKLSQGDIERYIEAEVGQPMSPSEFRAHELVQYELSVLDSMLDFFTSDAPDNGGIKQMRKVMIELGVSNLGIALNK